MENDYRNTSNIYEYVNIPQQKQILRNEIKREHKRIRNFYNWISKKSEPYFEKFAKIYNYKCAYCGIQSGRIKELRDFEIDHIICESSYKDKCIAGQIENLAFSCNYCNRKKSDLPLNLKQLHPDTNIHKTFYRDDMFYIQIKEEYISDSNIRTFYKELELKNEIRRIDFLLLSMYDLYDQLKEGEIKNKLLQAIDLLKTKRNSFVY